MFKNVISLQSVAIESINPNQNSKVNFLCEFLKNISIVMYF